MAADSFGTNTTNRSASTLNERVRADIRNQKRPRQMSDSGCSHPESAGAVARAQLAPGRVLTDFTVSIPVSQSTSRPLQKRSDDLRSASHTVGRSCRSRIHLLGNDSLSCIRPTADRTFIRSSVDRICADRWCADAVHLFALRSRGRGP